MKPVAHTSRIASPGRSILALAFTLIGLGLFEAWLFKVYSGTLLHAIAIVSSACLSTVALRRFSESRKICLATASTGSRRKAGDARKRLPGALVLFVLAWLLGKLIVMAWVLPLGAMALALLFLPWPATAFHYRNFFLPCFALLAGVTLAVAPAYGQIPFFGAPLAAWILWMCSTMSLLLQSKTRSPVEPNHVLMSGNSQEHA
jgi:hypothetical protein